MIKKAIYKIPDGKMIRVSLECQDDIIKDIKFTGDFFLYPEQGLGLLEEGLKNIRLNEVSSEIEEIIKNNKLILFGLTKKGIDEVIKKALNQND